MSIYSSLPLPVHVRTRKYELYLNYIDYPEALQPGLVRMCRRGAGLDLSDMSSFSDRWRARCMLINLEIYQKDLCNYIPTYLPMSVYIIMNNCSFFCFKLRIYALNLLMLRQCPLPGLQLLPGLRGAAWLPSDAWGGDAQGAQLPKDARQREELISWDVPIIDTQIVWSCDTVCYYYQIYIMCIYVSAISVELQYIMIYHVSFDTSIMLWTSWRCILVVCWSPLSGFLRLVGWCRLWQGATHAKCGAGKTCLLSEISCSFYPERNLTFT